MGNAKTIGLVSGRYIFHNPYREFVFFDKLKARGYKCRVFLPNVDTYPKGYTNEFLKDKVVQNYSPTIFDNTFDLIKKSQGIEYFLIGSDFKYSSLVIILRLLGKTIISYDSAGGMDHKNNFAQISCVKSDFYKRFMKKLGRIKISQKTVRITGSIIFEDMKLPILSKKDFCEKYKCKDKVIVYFPKSIFTFKKKLHTWVKGDLKAVEEIHQRHINLSKNLCEKIRNLGFNPLIKLHPGLLNSPFLDQELEFWDSLGVSVIEDFDAPSMLKHIDLGVSFKSQSALDVNYFRKPFMYLKEGNSLPINLPHAEVCSLPLGPSNEWGSPDPFVNHAMPSWVGGLADLNSFESEFLRLLQQKFPVEHYDSFIEHFWFSDDGRASDRILSYLDKL